MELVLKNDTDRMGWLRRRYIRRISKFLCGSALSY